MCKVFAQAFFKKLAVSKGSALVALRRERNLLNGVFFLQSFFFWPFCVKRKSVIGEEFSLNKARDAEDVVPYRFVRV